MAPTIWKLPNVMHQHELTAMKPDDHATIKIVMELWDVVIPNFNGITALAVNCTREFHICVTHFVLLHGLNVRV